MGNRLLWLYAFSHVISDITDGFHLNNCQDTAESMVKKMKKITLNPNMDFIFQKQYQETYQKARA